MIMEHMQPWEFYSIVALFSVFCALAAHSVTWDHMFKKIQKLEREASLESCGGCGGPLARGAYYCDYCGSGLDD